MADADSRLAETDGIEMTVEEEWGIEYGDPPVPTSIRPTGIGFWGQRHAEQEVERALHNAALPFVGQPKAARVVHRTVTRYYDATAWEHVIKPGTTGGEG